MQVVTVEIKKQGVNAKTGKEWTMYQIHTDDARTASGFDQVRVGDHVELYESEDGRFLNYSKVDKPQKAPVTAPQPAVQRFNGAGLDERQRAIIRQHSQAQALKVLELKGMLGQLSVEDLTPAKIRSLTDYFFDDVTEQTE